MLAKIKDILIIVNKGQLSQYKKIIPNGDNFGVNITYNNPLLEVCQIHSYWTKIYWKR